MSACLCNASERYSVCTRGGTLKTIIILEMLFAENMKGRSVCFVSVERIDLVKCPGNRCKQNKTELTLSFRATCVAT